MKAFKDNAGRTWTVTINVAAIKRVKSLVGVNLLDAAGGKLIEQLISDPVVLVDVLYALCQPEATAQGVSDIQFGEAMAGDAIDLGHHRQTVCHGLQRRYNESGVEVGE